MTQRSAGLSLGKRRAVPLHIQVMPDRHALSDTLIAYSARIGVYCVDVQPAVHRHSTASGVAEEGEQACHAFWSFSL